MGMTKRDSPKGKKWRRDRLLREVWNMTQEDYLTVIRSQDNRCAICRTTEAGDQGSFHVDHDHVYCVTRVIPVLVF